MTGLEAQIAFSSELDQQGLMPPADSKDIFYWLDRAQTEYIKELFSRYEKGEEEASYLDPIVIINEVNITPSIENSYLPNNTKKISVMKPSNHLFTVRVVVIRNDDAVIPCKFRRNDVILSVLQDPFNKPTTTKYLYNNVNDRITIYYPNSDTLSKMVMTYVKEPSEVTKDNTFELPEFLHPNLVSMAVDMYTQRHQLKQQRDIQSQNN